jgi:hypothetical protein
VTIDRILGEPITLLGYAPETTVAEKGVTIPVLVPFVVSAVPLFTDLYQHISVGVLGADNAIPRACGHQLGHLDPFFREHGVFRHIVSLHCLESHCRTLGRNQMGAALLK